MNRNLSTKEVVALFDKFISELADGDIEKIVGKPTKSNRQEKVEELATAMFKDGVWAHPESCAEAALEWVCRQLPNYKPASYGLGHMTSATQDYNNAISDVRKNLGLDS